MQNTLSDIFLGVLRMGKEKKLCEKLKTQS